MQSDWYEKNYRKRETPEFVEWFLLDYGKPEDYNSTFDELEEYWTRRAFSLRGWLACQKKVMTLIEVSA